MSYLLAPVEAVIFILLFSIKVWLGNKEVSSLLQSKILYSSKDSNTLEFPLHIGHL